MALSRKSTRGFKWSNESVKLALQIKFSCGGSGYETLLAMTYPLPSLRTLHRRLENLKFESGILEEVFDFLKIKVNAMKADLEHECMLILDEMSITCSKDYDVARSNFVGDVTLPGNSRIATHALVFMLGGIITRWKQTIAYYFTPNSENGEVLCEIIIDLVRKTEQVGLRVHNITSDMGSVNAGMKRAFGITCGKSCNCQFC